MKQSKQSQTRICVVGLGYIGLPTASMFATHGFQVKGVDTNDGVLEKLRNGEIHIKEPGLATVVKAAVASGNLTVGPTPVPSDAFIIAVPTPTDHAGHDVPTADLSHVRAALDAILPVLKAGNMVILESTSPPGTTIDVVAATIAKKTRLRPGQDVGVAYCPERVIPGQALEELVGNDRLIGAISATWGERAKDLYRAFVSGQIFVTSPTVAEMVKLLENTYRDVNIALANEVAVLSEKLGVNVWEIVDLANRHPRVNVHKPGPGVGGHCISVDPWFLVERFPQDTRLIRGARGVNDAMPSHVARRIGEFCADIVAPKVAVLGLTYKPNVDDTRESPALRVAEILRDTEPAMTLAAFDPYALPPGFPRTTLAEVLKDADLVVVLTAHDDFRLIDPQEAAALVRRPVVYDTQNALARSRWTAAGFDVRVLGDGATPSSRKTIPAG